MGCEQVPPPLLEVVLLDDVLLDDVLLLVEPLEEEVLLDEEELVEELVEDELLVPPGPATIAVVLLVGELLLHRCKWSRFRRRWCPAARCRCRRSRRRSASYQPSGACGVLPVTRPTAGSVTDSASSCEDTEVSLLNWLASPPQPPAQEPPWSGITP